MTSAVGACATAASAARATASSRCSISGLTVAFSARWSLEGRGGGGDASARVFDGEVGTVTLGGGMGAAEGDALHGVVVRAAYVLLLLGLLVALVSGGVGEAGDPGGGGPPPKGICTEVTEPRRPANGIVFSRRRRTVRRAFGQRVSMLQVECAKLGARWRRFVHHLTLLLLFRYVVSTASLLSAAASTGSSTGSSTTGSSMTASPTT